MTFSLKITYEVTVHQALLKHAFLSYNVIESCHSMAVW